MSNFTHAKRPPHTRGPFVESGMKIGVIPV